MKDDFLDVGCAVIYHQGKLLIAKRHEHDTLGGHWEFPGGKREPGESIEDCLVREVEEELAVQIRPVRQLRVTEHRYPERNLRLYFYLCAWEKGTPQTIDCAETAWILPQDLASYQFPPADRDIIDELMKQEDLFS